MNNKELKENLKNNGFTGTAFRLCDNWYSFIDLSNCKNKPINYLEIGANYGANLLSVAKTYGQHENSKLFCIDPWEDYNEYNEYKEKQKSIYEQFAENVYYSGHKDKIFIMKGYSHKEIFRFDDNYFDIIYIDGNHEPEFVLEDAILSFRRLKKEGIMIFDDYGWGGEDCTKKGIDTFTNVFKNKIEILGIKNSQMFIKKIKY
jgi:SAM-dependent methyltransferase